MSARARLGPVAAAGAVAAAWCMPATAPFVARQCEALGIHRRLRNPDGVALTFDDGPHLQGTPLVLEALERSGARATFFLVGEQVERYPTLAAEIVAAGHEVAVHGYRHHIQLRRLPRALENDLDRALDVIGCATGQTPRCHRPPYGVYSWPGLALTRHRGLSPVLWSRWGKDWSRSASVDSVVRRVTVDLAAGDIVLLHDADHYSERGSWRTTAAAVPFVLEVVSALGAPSVSISQSM